MTESLFSKISSATVLKKDSIIFALELISRSPNLFLLHTEMIFYKKFHLLDWIYVFIYLFLLRYFTIIFAATNNTIQFGYIILYCTLTALLLRGLP